MNKFYRIFIYLVFAWGVVFTIMGFPDMFDKNKTENAVAPWIALGLVPLAWSVTVYMRNSIKEKKQKAYFLEKNVLAAAHKFDGIITATELSLQLKISIDEARAILEKYVIKGVADTEITENGAVEFRFREIIREE